jgi:hypothetical protein
MERTTHRISMALGGFTLLLILTLIGQVAAQTCVQPPDGVVSWWPGDGNTYDITGGNHGKLQNGAMFAPGKVGQAFSLDGVDDYITFGNTIGNFGTSDFTMDFWIKTNSNRLEGILGKRPVCMHSNFWDIRIGTTTDQSSGIIIFELEQDSSGTTYKSLDGRTRANDGNFHHVAIVREGTTVSLYIDGILDASITTSGVMNLVNSADLIAGKSVCTGVDGTQFFSGLLDEVEIFYRALSPSEILDIFNAGSAGICRFLRIETDTGGNTGTVTTRLHGSGFMSGAMVKLMRAGQPDIIANPATVGHNGTTIAVTFDLHGAAVGPWDVVMTNPDGTSETLPAGFTVEEGRDARAWIDILGRPTMRAGRKETYTLTYGNRSNVDAKGVVLWVAGIPNAAVFELISPLNHPPQRPEHPIDWDQVPVLVDYTAVQPGAGPIKGKALPLFVSRIPPGTTNSIEFTLTISSEGPFNLYAWAQKPMFQSPMSDGWSQCLSGWSNITLDALGIIAPGSPCAITLAGSLAGLLGDLVQSSQDPSLWSLSQLLMDVTDKSVVLADCLGNSAPGFGQIVSAIQLISDGIDAIDDCAETADRIITFFASVVVSRDPNDKIGSSGAGTAHYLSGDEPLRYAIYFENVETATAAAQEVTITDQLDQDKLDLSTLNLGIIAFGHERVIPPQGVSDFAADVDLRPEKNLIARVTITLDPSTGLLTWRFTSINPATGQLTDDPLAGFLPPNIHPPEGDGHVLFTVMPKKGLPTGTEIQNQAVIVFDANPPIETPVWTNTIDKTTPTSHVLPLAPTQTSPSFQVQWSGTDGGSGILDHTIFVSEDDGPFAVFLRSAADTSATFTGQAGKTYAFYSVARDKAGNLEGVPTAPDATTRVLAEPFPFNGFFPPVDNPPTLNAVKAGQAIPVKFSLGGDHGLNIFATGYPVSQGITCDSSAPVDDVEQTVTADSSGLTYDPSTDQYAYVWKTNKSWAGTCRRLILRLTDETDHVAHFKFK